jgi:hypothetical protein
MLLKGDKKGLVSVIMKKMKGHGDMSPSFQSESVKQAPTVDGAEQDSSAAHDKCCNDIMSAVKSGDSQQFKSSLKSLISMMLEESDNGEEE